jgi:hypothetical protein
VCAYAIHSIDTVQPTTGSESSYNLFRNFTCVLFSSSFDTYCLSTYMVASNNFVTDANSKYSDIEAGTQTPNCACHDI